MARKKKKGDDVNTNAWMDTYADTITLLLTFFILLYSMSAVDTQKLNELTAALKNSLQGSTKVTDLKNIDQIKVAIEKDGDKLASKYEDLSKKLNKIIDEKGLKDDIKVREEDRGIVLQLGENILFDPGKADLKEDRKKVLDGITSIIKSTDNDVLVEGHTDDVPMHNKEFASNWELSTARAVGVVEYFVDEQKLDPIRFSAKGYGEFKPLVKNDTPEHRATNRRVDILIVEQKEK